MADYLRQLQAEQGGGVSFSSAAAGWMNPLAWLRYRSWTAVSPADDGLMVGSTSPRDNRSSGSSSSTDDVEEERQTVVIELAEHSATLS